MFGSDRFRHGPVSRRTFVSFLGVSACGARRHERTSSCGAADQDQALVQIARGEYAIGIGLSGRTAGELLKDSQPIAVVWPEDIGLYASIGHTIPVGAPHECWASLRQLDGDQRRTEVLGWCRSARACRLRRSGFAKPRIKKENLATNEELQVLVDKASALYKN